MASDWKRSRIGEHVDLLMGFPFKSNEFAATPGVKLARGMNVKRGVFEWSSGETKYWHGVTPELGPYMLEAGDILIGMDGSRVGENWVSVSDRDLPCLLVQRVARLRAKDCLYQGFLKYLIGNPAFADYVKAIHTGTSIPHISSRQIGDYSIPLPPLAEQWAIARILGALDNKIELNRRMNQTLEGMARAIFKSWFVDFDPVRAKAAGKKPTGLSSAIAKLFPDSFEDSELGEIPKGWKIGSVDDVANINARTLGRQDSLETIDYIEISEVMRGEIATVTRYARGEEPSRARRRLQNGDTALSTVRPDRGAFFLCLNPLDSLIASTGFAVLSTKTKHWAFLHSLVTRKEIGEELGRLADGGAYPAVRPEVVGKLPVIIPGDMAVIAAYETIARLLFERMEAGRKESRSLAAIRDALLPKLMSGELRITVTEQIEIPAELPSASAERPTTPNRGATDEFKEAILIAALVRAFTDANHPLGRKRYNKFAYMVHRKAEHDVQQQYVKKAAGPYSPWAKYEGPEKIAVKNGYVAHAKVGKLAGLVAGPKTGEINKYLLRYGFKDVVDWLATNFRYKTNDELELLATVDFAALDLRERGEIVNCSTIREAIAAEKEWAAKLNREIFNEVNIEKALRELRRLLPDDGTAV